MKNKNYSCFFLITSFLLMNFNGFSQEKNLWSKVNTLEKSERVLIKKGLNKEHKLYALDVVKLRNK